MPGVRSAKSKPTKTRTATSSKSSSKSKKPDTDEFDDWADALKPTNPGCTVCRHAGAAETLKKLLNAMIRKGAHRIRITDILKAVTARHPDAEIGIRSFERHLRSCVRPLYNQARGRKSDA